MSFQKASPHKWLKENYFSFKQKQSVSLNLFVFNVSLKFTLENNKSCLLEEISEE